jgi:hypothetical protein
MADEKDDAKIEERIPGERESDTAMHSTPGIMAGTGYGENIPTNQPDTLDDRTRHERAVEGGSGSGQKAKG